MSINLNDNVLKNISSSRSRLFSIAVATIVSFLSLEFFVIPYVGIALVWLITFWYNARQSKSNKAVWFNLGLVFLILGSVETYLYLKNKELTAIKETVTNAEGLPINSNAIYTIDDTLGYAPKKNYSVSWRKFYKNEAIYDVKYTGNKYGLRIAPPYQNSIDKTNKTCIFFFGGSFTFGEGLEDDRTLPYLVGIKSSEQFLVYNFGFRGYGPHQMLAFLETGKAEQIAKCKPQYVIYQAITNHAFRSAGLVSWDTHGPKYILNKEGKIIRQGNFDDDNLSDRVQNKLKSKAPKQIITLLKKSLIVNSIVSQDEKATGKEHLNLMVEIVDTVRNFVEKNYPQSKFHVIFWDSENQPGSEEIMAGIANKNINLHKISTIIPEYKTNVSKYTISEHDRHPNNLANEIISDYINNQIIDRQVVENFD